MVSALVKLAKTAPVAKSTNSILANTGSLETLSVITPFNTVRLMFLISFGASALGKGKGLTSEIIQFPA